MSSRGSWGSRRSLPHLRAVRELFVDVLTPDQLAVAGEIAAALRTRVKVPRAL
ncbi:hypothetical protein [Streptomyces brasiliensis]|uniref:MarR family transcriptional regulator n=1 Tax=Streptomyces brasiliensis TaxID=1954 RepID=A0A917P740_9ACTN|nr:hypothetical protein [Streptomyces brasiliensis]GGJ65025.1 hypothetical protein GCM10010121_089580 [Streptomyces brasiliensis]